MPSGGKYVGWHLWGLGKLRYQGQFKSSSKSVEFTVVGDKGVVKGGGEDSLVERGGGMGRARGEGRGRGMEACSRHSR